MNINDPVLVETPLRKVEKQWIDLNGHMNMAYYNVLFDETSDSILSLIGVGWDYTQQGVGSCFTAEVHVSYLQELNDGDPVRLAFQLLDWDEKRLHIFGFMYHGTEGYLAATSEQMTIHMDMQSRRVSPMPLSAQQNAGALMTAHKSLPRPGQAGRVIGIKPKVKKKS